MFELCSRKKLTTDEDCHLTYRQIATFLASLRELNNDNIFESYYELMDFVMIMVECEYQY